jgi:hypothetical protein
LIRILTESPKRPGQILSKEKYVESHKSYNNLEDFSKKKKGNLKHVD